MIKTAIVAYLGSALAMVGADSVWLTLSASRLYKPQLGDLLAPDFRPAPAILFYLLYLVGVIGLAVLPAVAARRLGVATLRGALLGLVAYATYDLTNQATLRVWSSVVTIADMGWGTFLTGFAASVGYWAATKLAPRHG